MSGERPISEAWRAHRAYLVDMAFRTLGDIGAAEDVVQEAFFRLLQAPEGSIDDERGWLIVVTGRLCLDHIKSAPSRREWPDDVVVRGYGENRSSAVDPADRVTLDDEVRSALLVVLSRLTPAERVAFVLHDVFQLPFEVIATTVGRPSTACRQLASRARRKIKQSGDGEAFAAEPDVVGAVTRRFIAACATGDFTGLLEVLDANASGWVDARQGMVVVGADRVARNLLRFWGEALLVSHPDDAAVLAFADRKLVGLIALAIDGTRITSVRISVLDSALEPVRARLFGAR